MSHRKLQLIGGSTYSISLPKQWVTSHALTPGDEIEVTPFDQHTLLLRPPGPPKPLETTFYVTGDMSPDHVQRALITRYLQGYSTIHVASDDYMSSEYRLTLKNRVKYLIGLEIYGDESESMTFKVLLKDDLSLTDTIGQMLAVADSSFDDLEAYLATGNQKVAADILQRDDEIDKFYHFILRMLSLQRGYASVYWGIVARQTEKIGDYLEDTAWQLTQTGYEAVEAEDRLSTVTSDVHDLFRHTSDLVAERNLHAINDVLADAKEKKREIRDYVTSGRPGGGDHLLFCYLNLKVIATLTGDICSALLNLT